MTSHEDTSPTPWSTPYAGEPISGRVVVPGSKSLTARELVLSALADGPSRIDNALRSRDSLLMAAALRVLGHQVSAEGESWTVEPGFSDAPAQVDCGLSGTVMRFVPPLAALRAGPTDFDGDPHARSRPIGPLLDGLRQVGATVLDDRRGVLPFRIDGRGAVRGGSAKIDASGSSQFVSGLLLSAARFDDGLLLHPTGAVPNRGHIAMTLRSMTGRGIGAAERHDGSWYVAPGTVSAATVTIEPDASNSAPFLAAAALTGGTVTIPYWPADSAQPIDRLLEVLGEYGATVDRTNDVVSVSGGERRGIDVDLRDIGDMTPVIAALCLFADGPSQLRGVGYIRAHETDRLAALTTELGRLGASVAETEDGLRIEPSPLHAATLLTYRDHRMVHAAAVAGLMVDGIEVDDVATTAKAMPQFARLWTGLVTGDESAAPEVEEMAR